MLKIMKNSKLSLSWISNIYAKGRISIKELPFELIMATGFFISWYFGNIIATTILAGFFSLFILIFSDDAIIFGSLVFMTLLSYSNLPYFDSLPPALYYQIGIIVSFIVLFAMKKVFITRDFKLTFGPIGLSLSLIVLVLFISSIVNQFTRDSQYSSYGYAVDCIGLLLIALYIFYASCSKKDSLSFLPNMLYSSNLLVIAEIIVWIIRGKTSSLIDLGWGTKNVVSLALEICIPFIAYIFSRNKWRFDAIIIISLDYYFVCDSLSRGGLITLLILTFLLAYIITNEHFKKNLSHDYFLSLGITCSLILLAVVFIPSVNEALLRTLKMGDDLSGREGIWKTALSYLTMDYPLGGSMSSLFEMYVKYGGRGAVGIWLCHNTLFTLLASIGIIGVIMYLYHLVEVFYSAMSYKYLIKNAVIYFLLVGLIHGLVDNTFFSITYMLPYILIMSSADFSSLPKTFLVRLKKSSIKTE